MERRLIIGTRGSKLALAQSETIAETLRQAHPGLVVELQIISTVGDRTQASGVALSALGDKGLFIKELEVALLDKSIDLAVHSCKDLPSVTADGLSLAAFPVREEPWDALVLPAGAAAPAQREVDATLSVLPLNARVGTSSLRRKSQLLALRPDLQVSDLRGNVDTRLRKLDEGQYDAIILASAGLLRIGLGERISQYFPAEQMVPAVAQGILGIECRADDPEVQALLAVLDDASARKAALAERAFLRRLEGGCQVPMGAYAQLGPDGSLRLTGMVGSLDGATIIKGERSAAGNPEALGQALAEDLLAQGAAALIEAV